MGTGEKTRNVNPAGRETMKVKAGFKKVGDVYCNDSGTVEITRSGSTRTYGSQYKWVAYYGQKTKYFRTLQEAIEFFQGS